jgi:soluble lytic murein transglycosylase-like protein
MGLRLDLLFRGLCVLLLAFCSIGGLSAKELSPRANQCVADAATYHQVSSEVLKAIVSHESRGRANTVARNTDGSIDVGMMGTNSVHFSDLQSKGVAPADLLDECYSIYVGAWMYSQRVFKYGNTWRAVGAYHSKTPYYNERYQVLIYNEMVRLGSLVGGLMAVPPLPGR